MDNDTLFNKLFNKSATELQKLEAEEGSAGSAPLLNTEESEEDRKIRESVSKFREMGGRDPETSKKGGGLFDITSIEDETSPALSPISPTDEATPAQERQLAMMIKHSSDFIYGSDMDKVIRSMKSQQDLFEGIGSTAYHIIRAGKQMLDVKDGGADKAVLFSQDGAIQLVVDQLWDVARHAGIEGTEDPNQYAAAVINVYRKFGEDAVNEGDDELITDAENAAVNMESLYGRQV